jgi:colanic acid/amylovoran biosynthesis protein
MKLVLWGVETNNKGAELMLYAILQEIERKFPDAEVYLSYSHIKQGIGYIHTSLDFKLTPYSEFVKRKNLYARFRRWHLPVSILNQTNIVKDADWFIDGSGFAFSDQWNIKDEKIQMWHDMLCPLRKRGCKVVFLPQAFGPADMPNTKRAFALLSDNADLIMPRERVSFDYLRASGVVDMQKVRMFTDFTSLVEGVFPSKYEQLRSGICIIPNFRMIDKGMISYDAYIRLLAVIISEGKKSGRPVYLLNHEGIKDEKLCFDCQKSVGDEVEVVTKLNALEVKGLIASAYLVVTSRFHGLVSALNSCVPSLATSWSHKYEELYHDYDLQDYMLPLNDNDAVVSRVRELLNISENMRIRGHLEIQVSKVKAQTREMWDCIWNL